MTRVLLRTSAILCLCAVVVGLLWSAAGSFAAAQKRNKDFRYLSEALDPLENHAPSVSWQRPATNLVRRLTRSDEVEIGAALTDAWRAYAAVSYNGQTTILADHFTGIALARAELSAQEALRDGSQMVVLEEELRPTFVHLDGSVIQLDALMTAVRFRIEDGSIVHYELSLDAALTTLTRDTTGWRILSHERASSRPVKLAKSHIYALPFAKGVNYYPSETPWRAFWPEFDARVISEDFNRIAALGCNSVRIFLPAADFANTEQGIRNLRNLSVLLELAEDRQLSVVATLFDLKSSYRPEVWADDVAYLRRVLPVLASSSAVSLVDLKNEPDLDRPAYREGLVDAWLTTVSSMARKIAPSLTLTIGWSDAESAADLIELVDVVSYHEYGDASTVSERFDNLRSLAGSKPIIVTEIGSSSYNLILGFPSSEAKQADLIGKILPQLTQADGIFIWALNDFSTVDSNAVGTSPWSRLIQSQFGLFDGSGNIKKSGVLIHKYFTGRGRVSELPIHRVGPLGFLKKHPSPK